MNRNKISILTFHGVMDFDLPCKWRPFRHRTSTEEFRRALEWISMSYQFIDLDTAVAILNGERAPIPNAIVITFDDGYRNNFELALPILSELGIPATFYVATGHVNTGDVFWFDRMDFAFQSAVRKDPDAVDSLSIMGVRLGKVRDARAAFGRIKNALKNKEQSESQFRAEIDTVSRTLEVIGDASLRKNCGDLWSDIVTWDKLNEADKNPLVTIGSHSINHTRLSFESEERNRVEVNESKRHLEDVLHGKCEYFAYPNGAHDERARRQVASAGYKSAVTSDPGMNAVGSDVYSLKRSSIPPAVEKYELYARLSGLHSVVSCFSIVFGWRRKISSDG